MQNLIKNHDVFGKLTVVMNGDEPYFIAKEVCDALGYSNCPQACQKLDDDEKLVSKIYISGQKRDVTLINESGLYSLIIGSNKPDAKVFKKWVTAEVLPSIRKNGLYATDVTIEKMLNDPDFAIGLLTKLKEEREGRIKAERTNCMLMHSNKTYTSTEIAKELNLNSAIQLNKILHEKEVQYKQNGTWVLYSKYSTMGLTSIKQTVLENDKIVYDRQWTILGREFLINLLKG